MNPIYPVYVISKGRWDSCLTVKALVKRSIAHRVVIEPQEFDAYAAAVDPKSLLVLPFSNLGQGSIPARNFVWEHSLEEGRERHWILDDNIRDFYLLHGHIKYRTTSGTTFRFIEDFADRYKNVALAGMQYEFFVPRRSYHPPFIPNTRIYSCILIKNDIPYRWRGRYNEDTDLSLRALKDGWCTALFITFVADKMTTMLMKGGNTDELYKDDGRLKMAQSLVNQHPDVVRVTWKWGRWQHHVDYRPFRKNKRILKPDAPPQKTLEEYGIKFRRFGIEQGTKSEFTKSQESRN